MTQESRELLVDYLKRHLRVFNRTQIVYRNNTAVINKKYLQEFADDLVGTIDVIISNENRIN